MSKKLQVMSSAQCLKDIKKFFPSPVLSTESSENFDGIIARYIEVVKPRDLIELIFVNDLGTATWEQMRYSRHKRMVIEREYQRHRDKVVQEHRDQLGKLNQRLRGVLDELYWEEQKAEKAQTEKEATEATKGAQAQANPSARAEDDQQANQPNPEDKLIRLSDRVDRLKADIREKKREIKKIQSQVPNELDYAKALQSGIDYFEQLDRLHREAIAWRSHVLSQIELYREGLGRILRSVSDEIIEAEYHEINSEGQSIAGTGVSHGAVSDETTDGGPIQTNPEGLSIAERDDHPRVTGHASPDYDQRLTRVIIRTEMRETSDLAPCTDGTGVVQQ